MCPLIYAELFTVRRPWFEPAKVEAVADAGAGEGGERVDHIAVKGRCATKIADLTSASSGGPPFLLIFNFQVRPNDGLTDPTDGTRSVRSPVRLSVRSFVRAFVRQKYLLKSVYFFLVRFI